MDLRFLIFSTMLVFFLPMTLSANNCNQIFDTNEESPRHEQAQWKTPEEKVLRSFSDVARANGVRYLLFTTPVEAFLKVAYEERDRDKLLKKLLTEDSQKSVKLTPMFDSDKGRHAAQLMNFQEESKRSGGVDYYYDHQWRVGFLIPVELLDHTDFSAHFVTMQGPPTIFEGSKIDTVGFFKLMELAATFERHPEGELAKRQRLSHNGNLYFELPTEVLPESFDSLLWLPAPAMHRLNPKWKDYPGAGHPKIPQPGAWYPVRIAVDDTEGYMGYASASLEKDEETQLFFDANKGYGTWFHSIPDWHLVEDLVHFRKFMGRNQSEGPTAVKPNFAHGGLVIDVEAGSSNERKAYENHETGQELWGALMRDQLLVSHCPVGNLRQTCGAATLTNTLQYLLARQSQEVLSQPQEFLKNLVRNHYKPQDNLTFYEITTLLHRLLQKQFSGDSSLSLHAVEAEGVTEEDPFYNGFRGQTVDIMAPEMLDDPGEDHVRLLLMILVGQNGQVQSQLVISRGVDQSRQFLDILDPQDASKVTRLKLEGFERINGHVNANGVAYGGTQTPVYKNPDHPSISYLVGAAITVGDSYGLDTGSRVLNHPKPPERRKSIEEMFSPQNPE